jgi:hypothetical protein
MENIRIIDNGAGFSRIAVAFTEKGNRFHVWLDKDGNPEDILYKNPPLEIYPKDRGFFETIKLDATNKTNAPKIEKLMQVVRDDDMIAKARAGYHEHMASVRKQQRIRSASLYRASLAIVIEQMTAKNMEPLTTVATLHNFLTNATDEQIIALGDAMVGAGV